jgi:hypothetical protein
VIGPAGVSALSVCNSGVGVSRFANVYTELTPNLLYLLQIFLIGIFEKTFDALAFLGVRT